MHKAQPSIRKAIGPNNASAPAPAKSQSHHFVYCISRVFQVEAYSSTSRMQQQLACATFGSLLAFTRLAFVCHLQGVSAHAHAELEYEKPGFRDVAQSGVFDSLVWKRVEGARGHSVVSVMPRASDLALVLQSSNIDVSDAFLCRLPRCSIRIVRRKQPKTYRPHLQSQPAPQSGCTSDSRQMFSKPGDRLMNNSLKLLAGFGVSRTSHTCVNRSALLKSVLGLTHI